jgi:hypothetical protein
VSPGSGRNKGPAEAGPEEEPFRSFYTNGGDSSFEPATYSKAKTPTSFLRTSARDLCPDPPSFARRARATAAKLRSWRESLNTSSATAWGGFVNAAGDKESRVPGAASRVPPRNCIEGLEIQDIAITESMGPVVDHCMEHLAPSDMQSGLCEPRTVLVANSAPTSTTMVESHIHIIKPTTAPSAP